MKLRVIGICAVMLILCRLPAQQMDKLFLEKIHEPNEKAFTILKPKGWLVEGGIVRWDVSIHLPCWIIHIQKMV